MRDSLIAFIRAVQAKVTSEEGYRQQVRIGEYADGPSLLFGYGYYDAGKVLYFPSESHHTMMEVEAGVDAYMAAAGLSETKAAGA